MKKVAIAIALLALVIGATYGGVALAAKSPGTPVVMEAISGGDYALGGHTLIVGQDYPNNEIRHISLTLTIQPLQSAGDIVSVNAAVVPAQYGLVYELEGPTTDTTFVTLDFNAFSWRVDAWETGGPLWALAQYGATITYPK